MNNAPILPPRCSVTGCPGGVIAKGFCTMHYKRWKRYGDPTIRKRVQAHPPGAQCKHPDGCPRAVKAAGWCRMHYDRIVKYGEPGPVGSVRGQRSPRRLGVGRTTNSQGYVLIWQPDLKKYLFEHRLVMQEAIGRPLEPHESVHHMNGVRDDNDPGNLELWVVPPRKGQRVTDLVEWVVNSYPAQVEEALRLLNQT